MLTAFLPLCALAQAPTQATAVFVRAQDPDAERLSGAFESQLSRALIGKGLEVVDFGERFPPPAPASLEEGERLMEAGREAFNNLDPDTAFSKFSAAAAFFGRHPVETTSEQMARAFVALGATALLDGKPQKAQDAFRRALMLSPGVQVEELFGHEAKQALEEARAALESCPRGEIRVDSRPSGASVQIDGADADLTPVPAREVPTGRHHIVLRRPGYVPFGAFPDVVAGKPAEICPTLEPLPGMKELLARVDRVLAPDAVARSGAPSQQIQSLGKMVGARFLVLARVASQNGRTRAEVEAWDLSTGNRLDGLFAELDARDWRSTDRLAEEVRKWVSAPPAVAQGRSFELPPVLKQWWFWAAVGGAAAATAGVVAVSQGGGHRPNLVLGTP